MSREQIAKICDGLILACLLVLVLWLPVEVRGEGIKNGTVYAALGLWIIRLAILPQFILPPKILNWSIVLYLVVCFVASLESLDRQMSLRILRREFLMALMIFYLVVAHFDSLRKIRWLLMAFLAGGVITVIAGTVIWLLQMDPTEVEVGRMKSLFRNPNRLAQYLLFLGALCVVGMAIWRHRMARIGLATLLVVVLLNLFWTYSRAAWIALFPTMMLLGLGMQSRGQTAVRRTLIITPLVLVILGVVAFSTQSGRDRITGGLGGDERLMIYKSSWQVFRDYPVLGIGYGDQLFLKVYRETYMHPDAVVDHSGTHNIFLQTAVETGTLGLIAFLFLHLVIAGLAISAFRRSTDPERRWLLLWGLACLVAIFAVGQLHTLYRDRNILIFWTIFAVITSLHRQVLLERQDSAPKAAPAP